MEIKITKELEEKINSMMKASKELECVKEKYPKCFQILNEQFLKDPDYGKEKILDTEENTKVRLYAEIIRKDNEIKTKVGKQLNSYPPHRVMWGEEYDTINKNKR